VQGIATRSLQLPVTIKRALEDRNYRPLYHLLCAIIIVAAGCFLFYRSFGHHGVLMATDMTWPDTISRLQFKVSNTWTPYMGGPLTIDPLFLFWVYPSSMAARLLQLSASQYMFAMYFATFSLAGISMYVLAYSTLRKINFKNAATYAPYAGALIAALVYMYNPWSITYLKPYFAFPLYALLPLVFLAMSKTFDSPSARNIILFSIFITFANTTYQLTWLWGLIISYAVFFITVSRPRKQAARKCLRVLPGTLVLYFLLNAHWIFPYLGARIIGKPYVPFYGPELSRTMVSGLSSNNYLANNFRLLSVWTWSVDQLKGGFLFQTLSYAIPIVAVLGLVLAYRMIKRNRTVTYWATVAMLALLLTTGAGFIIRRPYLYFTFNAPGSGIYGWLLRTSERWAFFVPIFMALMIGILICKLLEKRPTISSKDASFGSRWRLFHESSASGTDKPEASDPISADRLMRIENNIAFSRYSRNSALALIISTLVLTSMFPRALSVAQNDFNPVTVPGNYSQLKRYLARQPGEPRVAWMPFIGPWSFTYSWSNGRPVDAYGPMNSNPNLHSNYEIMNGNSYFNWLQNLYLKSSFSDVMLASGIKKDILAQLLVPFAARYLIMDTSLKDFDFGNNLVTETSVEPVYKTDFLRVFKTANDPGYIWGATRTVNANSFYDNLAFTQKFTAEQLKNVAFTDGKPYFGDKSPVLRKYGGTNLDFYMKTINANSGFEAVWPNGEFPYWKLAPDAAKARISADKTIKAEGKQSLRIENEQTSNICFVNSEEVPVQTEGIYGIESSIKYKNVSWSEVAVQGYEAERGEWINLAYCPTIRANSSDWQKHHISFYVPPGITKIRAQLGGGWVNDPKKGPAVTWFDNVKILKVQDEIYSRIMDKEEPPIITSRKISAEKYRVKVKGAKAPFVLVLSEEYDGKWVATTSDGKKSDSIPMYSTINGFPINKTGDFEVMVEYRPQAWFSLGLAVSLLVLLLCLLFILYEWRRKVALAAREIDPNTAVGSHLNEFGVRVGRLFEIVFGALGRTPGNIRSHLEEPPGRWPRRNQPRRPGGSQKEKALPWLENDDTSARKSGRLSKAASATRSPLEEPPKHRARTIGHRVTGQSKKITRKRSS
jgi:hypothetical protein